MFQWNSRYGYTLSQHVCSYVVHIAWVQLNEMHHFTWRRWFQIVRPEVLYRMHDVFRRLEEMCNSLAFCSPKRCLGWNDLVAMFPAMFPKFEFVILCYFSISYYFIVDGCSCSFLFCFSLLLEKWLKWVSWTITDSDEPMPMSLHAFGAFRLWDRHAHFFHIALSFLKVAFCSQQWGRCFLWWT